MCLLCVQVCGQQFQATQLVVGLYIFIAPAELLDDGNVAATRQMTATDSVPIFPYFRWCGDRFRGGFGDRTIQSASISAADQDYFTLAAMAA